MSAVRFRRAQFAVCGAGIAFILLTSGCSSTTDEFAESCDAQRGSVLEDKASTTSVNSNGGVGFGSVTVRICVVNGDVVDMEVKG